MRHALTLTITIAVIIASVFIIGCGGGGDPVAGGERGEHCGNLSLNDKGEIICYTGDYGYILNYRCERCHDVEHRKNP